MQTIILLLTVTLTLLKPKGYFTSEIEDVIEWFDSNHMQANPGNSQAFSWIKEGTVIVRVSQYKIIMLNVKIKSNY